MLWGRCKLKQWDATTHLRQWPKSETLTIGSGKRNGDQQLVGIQNGAAKNKTKQNKTKQNGADTLEDSLAGSYKTKHIVTIWSGNHAPRYPHKRVENSSPHKILHLDAVKWRYLLAISINKKSHSHQRFLVSKCEWDLPKLWSSRCRHPPWWLLRSRGNARSKVSKETGLAPDNWAVRVPRWC